jgi:hypothetical protein
MDDFYEHINRKAKYGIPYVEAVQLMLWMFLTIGYIPKEFQKLELSKSNFAILFAKLSTNGKIIIGLGDNVCTADIARPEYWEDLVERLLQRKITLDETFPGRFSRYM